MSGIESAIESLPALTEGEDRIGTARWPQPERDAYSLAIEEAQAVLRAALRDDPMTCDHEAQIRDLLEEREELLTEIRRLRMGNHPAGRALPHLALAEALTERDAGHDGGEGA